MIIAKVFNLLNSIEGLEIGFFQLNARSALTTTLGGNPCLPYDNGYPLGHCCTEPSNVSDPPPRSPSARASSSPRVWSSPPGQPSARGAL